MPRRPLTPGRLGSAKLLYSKRTHSIVRDHIPWHTLINSASHVDPRKAATGLREASKWVGWGRGEGGRGRGESERASGLREAPLWGEGDNLLGLLEFSLALSLSRSLPRRALTTPARPPQGSAGKNKQINKLITALESPVSFALAPARPPQVSATLLSLERGNGLRGGGGGGGGPPRAVCARASVSSVLMPLTGRGRYGKRTSRVHITFCVIS
jgi:hypothetical protein